MNALHPLIARGNEIQKLKTPPCVENPRLLYMAKNPLLIKLPELSPRFADIVVNCNILKPGDSIKYYNPNLSGNWEPLRAKRNPHTTFALKKPQVHTHFLPSLSLFDLLFAYDPTYVACSEHPPLL